MSNENNKRALDSLEASLRSYNPEDDDKSGLINFKEVLKKVGVVIINSGRGIVDVVDAGLNALMGAAHVAKVVAYDVPSYVLSPDDISSNKTWNALKEDVNASKDYTYEVYLDVGAMASDVAKVIEHGSRAVYHAGKATGSALVFAYDAAKTTTNTASNAIDSLNSKVGPMVMTRMVI